jgi:pimeloyl-ACP methyl ester carboxylesterase
MSARAWRALAAADSQILWRDPLLGWVLLLPLGVALMLRVLIPPITDALADNGFRLERFYPLIMSGYLMTAPGIVGMVVGFMLLDERDARTLSALRVSPLSIRAYLGYRLTGPLIVGTLTTLVAYPLAGLADATLDTSSDRRCRRAFGANAVAGSCDRRPQQGRWIRCRQGLEPGQPAAIGGLLRADAGAAPRRYSPRLLRRSQAGVQSAMKHMIDLSSGVSVGRRQQIERESHSALLGNAINFPEMYEADAWAPVADLGDDFRQPVRSPVPTLIFVGDLDPRTPLENGREIAATLPASRLVVLENATHQFDFFGSSQIRDVLAKFLCGEDVRTTSLSLPAVVFQK